jgi:hypothetical protein
MRSLRPRGCSRRRWPKGFGPGCSPSLIRSVKSARTTRTFDCGCALAQLRAVGLSTSRTLTVAKSCLKRVSAYPYVRLGCRGRPRVIDQPALGRVRARFVSSAGRRQRRPTFRLACLAERRERPDPPLGLRRPVIHGDAVSPGSLSDDAYLAVNHSSTSDGRKARLPPSIRDGNPSRTRSSIHRVERP